MVHANKKSHMDNTYNKLLLSGKHVQGTTITDFLALQAPP